MEPERKLRSSGAAPGQRRPLLEGVDDPGGDAGVLQQVPRRQRGWDRDSGRFFAFMLAPRLGGMRVGVVVPMSLSDGPGRMPTWQQVRAFGEHAEAAGLRSLSDRALRRRLEHGLVRAAR